MCCKMQLKPTGSTQGIEVSGAETKLPINIHSGQDKHPTDSLLKGISDSIPGVSALRSLLFGNKKKADHEKACPVFSVIENSWIEDSPLLKPEFQKKIDELTNSKVVPGNKVTLLKNGAESFPIRFEDIENEKHSINLQTLIFHPDETGLKMADLLCKKAKEGVKVRLILDWTSCIGANFPYLTKADEEMINKMKEAGIKVRIYNPPADYKWHMEQNEKSNKDVKHLFNDAVKSFSNCVSTNPSEFLNLLVTGGEGLFQLWKQNNEELIKHLKNSHSIWETFNNRAHMKIQVTGGRIAIVGGMNIGSEYANGGTDKRDLSQGEKAYSAETYRDTDKRVEGPAVTEVLKTFAKNWAYLGGENPEEIIKEILNENPPPPVAGNVDVRFIAHRPLEEKDKNIENWYLTMLENCQRTAYFENAYFLPTPEFKQALIDAAKRGCDVRVFTNSKETNDLPILSQGGRYHYKDLIKAGVKIYELQKNKDENKDNIAEKNKKDKKEVYNSLHTKAASFDGIPLVGSHNLDPRSFKLNSENAFVTHDKEFGIRFNQMYKEDLETLAKEVTLDDLNNDTIQDRIEQWFAAQIINELL